MNNTILNERMMDLGVILKCWIKNLVKILLISLLIGICFSGMQYIRKATSEKISENDKKLLKVYIDTLESYEEQENSIYDYLNNSVCANIDPYNESRSEIAVSISPTRTDNSEITAIAQMIKYGFDYSEISKELKLEERYIEEIVTTTVVSNSEMIVAVKHFDDTEANKLSNWLHDIINNSLKEEGIVFSTQVKKAYKTIDEQLLNKGKTIKDQYTETIQQLKNNQTSIKSKIANIEAIGEPISKTQIIKHFILGFVGGLIALSALYVVVLSLSNKLLSKNELSQKYGLQKYFVVDEKTIDDNKAKYILSSIPELNMNNKACGLLSTETNDSVDKLCKLINKNANKGLCVPIQSINNNIESLDEINNIENVILVEKLGKSNIDNIEQAINYLEARNCPILGYVIVE